MSQPDGWSRVTLGDVVDVIRRRANPQKCPHFAFVGMDDVEAHTMRILGTVPASTMKSSATHFLPGDVLYGRLRPYLNKVVQPEFEGLASAEFIPLTPAHGIRPDFIRLRINAADFVAYASRLDEGDRPRVDWDGIRRFEMLLPPSAEQERITEAVDSLLSRLDAAVASLERAQVRLKAYRASVLKAAVEGQLVPTEAELAGKGAQPYESAEVLLARILKERRRRWEETQLARMKTAGKTPKDDRWKTGYHEPASPNSSKLPALPEGWCWARLDQVSELQLGQQRSPVHAASAVQIPYVRAANITWDGLDLTDVKRMGFPNPARYRLLHGDVLLSEASGSPMEAGKPAIWRDEIPGACYQKTLIRVRAIDHHALLPEYLRLVFLRDCVTGKFARLAPGVGIVHLTAERMLPWPIPLPPISEQHRIVDEVDRIESIQKSIRASASQEAMRIQQLRQAVLKWAFEGKLADQDASDEPAEKLLAHIRAERTATVPTKKTRVRRRIAAS